MSETPAPRKRRNKLIFLMCAGALGIGFLVMGAYQLVGFMDTTSFCGVLCHKVMHPEYTVYQGSPHSRVTCSACHVGSGAGYLVKSKLSGIPMIYATLTGTYQKPIPTPVVNLRPARETCEQCHRPEKFSGDLVVTHTTYKSDEKNTQQVDTRTLRVGGGESAVAQGIHWHIAAKVWYLPLDAQRQQIAWVGVEDASGNLTQYVDPSQTDKVTPQIIQKEKRLMDCIDCHNRATHIFSSPEDLIDTAMSQGKIDSTLQYIKQQGINALDPVNTSLNDAYTKIDAIKDFYRTNYPSTFANKMPAIEQAIAQLKEVARLTTFPDMKVSWQTYPNNIGHGISPGCFRCHGKLQVMDGPQQGTTINMDCNLCHYLN